MQANDKEIMEAIARSNKKTQADINNLSRAVKQSPHLVERHYNGSPLSIMELKQFADWKGRLPNDLETQNILFHGVGAIKKLFKETY
jgi:hypothetical protein